MNATTIIVIVAFASIIAYQAVVVTLALKGKLNGWKKPMKPELYFADVISHKE